MNYVLEKHDHGKKYSFSCHVCKIPLANYYVPHASQDPVIAWISFLKSYILQHSSQCTTCNICL